MKCSKPILICAVFCLLQAVLLSSSFALTNESLDFYIEEEGKLDTYCYLLKIDPNEIKCSYGKFAYYTNWESIKRIYFYNNGKKHFVYENNKKAIRVINEITASRSKDKQDKLQITQKEDVPKNETFISTHSDKKGSTGYVKGVNSQAYDFRSFKLGTPLFSKNHFKHPDERKSNARFICCNKHHCDEKGNPHVSLFLQKHEERFNVTRCRWVKEIPSYLQNSYKWENASIDVGEGFSSDYSFLFIRPPDSEVPRLFKIKFSIHRRFFDGIAEGLSAKYGRPKRRNIMVRNKLGVEYPNEILTWKNGETTIDLYERFLEVNHSQLIYSYDKLAELYEKSRDQYSESKTLQNL